MKPKKAVSFKTINNDEEMQRYLRQILYRTNKNLDETFLYHYTSIQSIQKIIESGYFFLNSFENMNDQFEKDLLERHGKKGKLYYMSFSKADESLALYDKYCNQRESGALLKISYANMQKIIKHTQFKENIDGVFADGRYDHTRRSFYQVEDNKLTEKKVFGDIFCGSIVYYDPISKKLKCGTVENQKFKVPFQCKELLGFVKYKCWAYEEEIRLFVSLEGDSMENRKIAVPIDEDSLSQIEVITNPYFDKDKNKTELSKIREYGVNIRNSIYEGCIV